VQVNLSPDVEALVQKRLATGAFNDAEDVIRCALESQLAESNWTEEDLRALSTHVEAGFQQAERGDVVDGAQARREIQRMKNEWLEKRPPR
jgi:Arc/MetJ-type ribon-helix-helix transcriptional regulator